jgi:hypothetical protein
MYRSTACLMVIALGGCFADVEPATIQIDDTAGNDAREVVAAPGDTVQFRAMQVAVPDEIGAGNGMVAEGEDGWLELVVENRGNGIAFVRTSLEAQVTQDEPEPTTAAVNPACSDGAYRLEGHRWSSPYEWYLNDNTSAAKEAMIRRGANNIVLARNDCDLVDNVDARHVYLGRTGVTPNFYATAGCLGRDGRNVVGMGQLVDFKAYTCWYWDGSGSMVEADIQFKAGENWITTTTVPADCVDGLHLESVATHEMGHVFGLLHPENNHPALTMQPGGTCSAKKATLGLGDVRGLRALY